MIKNISKRYGTMFAGAFVDFEDTKYSFKCDKCGKRKYFRDWYTLTTYCEDGWTLQCGSYYELKDLCKHCVEDLKKQRGLKND